MGKKFRNKDIAVKLGLSGTLVSLVLNNKGDQHGIRKETQEKVLSLAKQMGYFESLVGKNETSPVEDKPGVMGMIVPSLTDPFIIQITPLLHREFLKLGFGFSILTRDPDDQRYDRLSRAFKKFYTGFILVGEASDENTIRNLRATNYPFIVLENHLNVLHLNSVCTDSAAGANIVVNHLTKLGYKNILILSEQRSYNIINVSVQDLTDAIEQVADLNKPIVIELDNTGTGDEIELAQFEKYIRPPYRADVIIVMKAHIVYPLMRILRNKKLRIPQDIAVVSMEDGIGFDLMFSPVTCLRKPLAVMAVKTANMIWSEVRNSGKGKFKRQVNISPELVVRNSCGSI